MVWSWRLGSAAGVLLTLALLGCSGGDDDDDDAAEAKKPDTGYGAAQMVPTTRTCADLCTRLGDCFEVLCNEDTMSTRYDGLGDLLASSCELDCTEATLQSQLTADQWQCFFQSSCRQVLDYDTCHGQSSYHCQ